MREFDRWVVAAAAIAPIIFVHLTFSILRAEPVQRFLDPFLSHRRDEYLGQWRDRQSRSIWPLLLGASEPPPLGPELVASMAAGLCGQNSILISRCPVGRPATASWALLLAGFHESNTSIRLDGDQLVASKPEWNTLSMKPLTRRGEAVGVPISRTTLMTLLVLSNSRPTFEYSDASGYRANYASYFGQWYIFWPLGKPAVVNFLSHDSHSPAGDVYPTTFKMRVDRCIQMMAGVVVNNADPNDFNIGFPGRVPAGRYQLEFQAKGFGGTHGSRHIYNMNGGKVFDVDFLFLKPVDSDRTKGLELQLPSLEDGHITTVRVPDKEQEILAKAMDLLPWSSLSWSLHRGFHDLLLAYSRPTMDRYRQPLADRLRQAVTDFRDKLVKMGWDSSFVDLRMADMAASAVLAGRGNSGDLVRVVTCLAELAAGGSYETLDQTRFWKDWLVPSDIPSDLPVTLSGDAVVALTKVFTLEWSQNFDYQLYHQLPISLLLD